MWLYHCSITFHDSLFYESRVLGRLYETSRLLHNFALSYALGFAMTTFYHALNVPQYQSELEPLNERGIYVFPAKSENIRYSVNTFKFGGERNTAFMERSVVNLPTYGKAKEVAIGSRFQFGILSADELLLPSWIRMGVWMSKAELLLEERVSLEKVGAGENSFSIYPLNPRDLPPESKQGLTLFNMVAMRPSVLVEDAVLRAKSWWYGKTSSGQDLFVPFGMAYRF